jgi:hypothetical protein
MIKDYTREIGGFAAGYIWTLITLTIGANETVQEGVCSVEEISGGLISPEICNGFTHTLQQIVTSGNLLFHITAAFTGLLIAFAVYSLSEE